MQNLAQVQVDVGHADDDGELVVATDGLLLRNETHQVGDEAERKVG